MIRTTIALAILLILGISLVAGVHVNRITDLKREYKSKPPAPNQVNATASRCGGKLTTDHGEINFPGNGKHEYDNYQVCIWTMITRPGSVFKLTFTEFHLEDCNRCRCDYLELQADLEDEDEMDIVYGKFCGTDLPGNNGEYITESNSIRLVFESDYSLTYSGFRMTWDTVCGGQLTTEDGEISFPMNAGAKYDNKQDCVWTLQTTPGWFLKLTFKEFDIERSTGCIYDYLKLEDGPSSVGKFCYTNAPGRNGVYITNHNNIRLVFHSDGSVTRYGFRMAWMTVCGGKYTAEDGEVNYPADPGHQYDNNQDCIWTLSTTPGMAYKLIFTEFNLEASTECQHDYLELQDELDSGTISLGKFCGTNTPGINGEYTTNNNYIRLVFHSNYKGKYNGFQMKWTAFEKQCETQWEKLGLNCYQLQLKPKNFADAEADCQSKGAHIMSMSNADEMSYYETAIKERKEQGGDGTEDWYATLTGLNLDATKAQIDEFYSKNIFSKLKWSTGANYNGKPSIHFGPPLRPNSKLPSCAQMSSYSDDLLDLIDCNFNGKYYCQKDKDASGSCSDWTEINNYCYHVEGQGTYEEATAACQSMSGRLPVFRDEDNTTGLHEKVNGWLGLKAENEISTNSLIAEGVKLYRWIDDTDNNLGLIKLWSFDLYFKKKNIAWYSNFYYDYVPPDIELPHICEKPF